MSHVTVHACISPSGAAGVKLDGEHWSLSVTVVAWVLEGENRASRAAVYLRKPGLDQEELRQLMRDMPAMALLRLRLKSTPAPAESGSNEPLRAELVSVDGPSPHPALQSVADELARPVQFRDATLGGFTLDRTVEWFEGKATWLGTEITVHLSAPTEAEALPALEAAHALWQEQEAWHRRIEDNVLESLLQLKNESWADEGEQVTAQQFKEALSPESVTLYDDGSFEFFFDDGDLFWGHVILVSGDLANGPTSATIAG